MPIFGYFQDHIRPKVQTFWPKWKYYFLQHVGENIKLTNIISTYAHTNWLPKFQTQNHYLSLCLKRSKSITLLHLHQSSYVFSLFYVSVFTFNKLIFCCYNIVYVILANVFCCHADIITLVRATQWLEKLTLTRWSLSV